MLCGGAGDDLLIGGNGRSLQIGEGGADRLVGNSEDDILIAGLTSYGCDHEALCAIFDEWTRRDRSYAQRVSNLTNGGGLNGNVTLNARTVFDDGAADLLTGSAGLDWFFAGANDKITDKHPTEIITTTDSLATLAIGVSKRRSIIDV